jgi:hypothetical protein
MHLLHTRSRQAGGTLVVTLVICSVLAFSVLGYLSVIEQQGLLGHRSQSWNIAMTVAESGIEEGLQHLNKNFSNLATDGWSLSGSLHVRSNALPNGNAYTVAIQNGSQPVIISKSYVAGVMAFAQSAQGPVFGAVGSDAVGLDLISRAVRVRCYRSGFATKAMAARETIDLNGNNILTDSFDSEDPAKSRDGLYDPTRAGSNGDVASNATIMNSVDIGNANIYGRVATGPGGTVALGPNGGVGSHAWQAANPGTMQPEWVTHDSNFTFPDTTIPYTSGLTPESGNVVETILVVTTNSTTSDTFPGSSTPGLQTNVTATTTSPTYPNPQPYWVTTNSTIVTSSTYPNPEPSSPIRTNYIGTVTSTTYPNPAPPGVITNINTATSTTLPNPIPSTITTNTTWVMEVKKYPEPGTYVGEVETNGKTYSYWAITGYTWTYLSYTYDKYTYTYVSITYTYPTAYNYTYEVHTTSTVYQTNYYDNILYSGKYYMETLSGKTIVLGQAELVSANGINMSANDVLKIKTGGSLTNWVGGTTVAIGGNGVVNETGLAKNYVCFCAPSVTDVAIGGNGEFTGVFIAPNGDIDMNGSGSNRFDFIGSVMVNSVKLNGYFQFHYDEALGRLPASGRFLISSWDEVPVNTTSSGTADTTSL